MHRITAVALVLLCSVAAGDGLRLVPTPQRVTIADGTFAITAGDALRLGDPNDAEDRFAAEQLVDEVNTDFGIALTVGASGRITIGRIGRDDAVADLGVNLPEEGDAEGYVLVVKPDGVTVAGKTAAGTFYGVQTLKLLMRANAKGNAIPCCTIIDWPALGIRAWQDDISRGPIPTVDFLKREIRTMAEYKQNAFTMYTEHVFKLMKHPTIAPPDGITADEVKELVAYAKGHHVQVIGNFQSFGHFANILNVPGYEHLGEAGWVISPAKEESYEFLADVYSEIAPAYESPLFNINCDETGGLGSGASKEMVEKEGIGAVYARHINRIADLLKPYGKTPMMWGDIALGHRDIVPRLPKDLIVLCWGYHPGESFDDMIKPFTEMGFRFMVCPGVSCWGQIYPDLDTATINISNFTRDGARLGAMGMLNTTWDDTGENLFGSNWYPLLWGAECAWNPVIPDEGEDADKARAARAEAFAQSFDGVFFGLDGHSVASGLRQIGVYRNEPGFGGMRDGVFWWDLGTAGRDAERTDHAAEVQRSTAAACEALLAAKRKAVHNVDALDYAAFAARKIGFLGERALAALDIGAVARDPSRRDEARKSLVDLAKEARSLRTEYERLWNLENRPWWLDRNLPKYDRLTQQLSDAPDTPIASPHSATVGRGSEVALVALTDGQIRYTLDGEEPTAESPLYSSPIRLTETTQLRARLFRDGKPVGSTASETYRMLTLPARFETPLPTYEGNGPENAFDGDEATFFWSARAPASGETFTVVLDEPVAVKTIRVVTGHRDHPQDFVHQGVLEISTDGSAFSQVAEFAEGTAEAELDGKEVKAIRIRLTQDNGYWLVIREIGLELGRD